MNLEDIEDDVIYTLPDVERYFKIEKMKLIKYASDDERKIRLCIPLEQYHEVNLINTNELIDPLAKSVINLHLAPQSAKLSNFTKVNKYQAKSAISIIIPLKKCVSFCSTLSLECTMFKEVYIRECLDGKNKIIREITALEYARQLNLQGDPKYWSFAIYPCSIIPPQNAWEPRLYQISRDDLCVYGFELRRYFLDKVNCASKTAEVKQKNSSKKEAIRDDPCRLEIKAAIAALIKEKKKATPYTVMSYLKSKAGQKGCAITRLADDQVSVFWLNSSGKEENLDNKNLKNRLTYLRKTDPELFNTELNKD